MSESYIESVRPLMAERETKLGAAVTMLRQIVRTHSRFETGSKGDPLTVPPASWRAAGKYAFVWLELRSADDSSIPKADVIGLDDRASAVDFATFELSDGYEASRTIMTIETNPPNIRGYDGNPLTLTQIDGALADLQHYGDALAAGETGA